METIDITVGPQTGRSFALTDNVMRLGSAPAMSIQLDATPPHAVTLVRKQRHFEVINRGCKQLKVNGKEVRQGSTAKWRLGRSIQINNRVGLKLSESGSMQPAAYVETHADGDVSSFKASRRNK